MQRLQKAPWEASTGAERLLSRLLYAADGDASIEFIFGGGGALEFSWRINGWIHDAASETETLRKATSLHQNLLLLLASEPAFRFEAGGAGD